MSATEQEARAAPVIRDRVVAAGAVGVLLVLALLIAGLVLDAQQNGIESREDLRLEQVGQLAASMDSRVSSSLTSIDSSNRQPWNLTVGDPDDLARLQRFGTSTGSYLVDRQGTVVNGSLLLDPSVVGKPIPVGDLEPAFDGTPVLLPMSPGLTQAGSVMRLLTPARNDAGEVAGVMVLETPVTFDSSFNQEVAELRAGTTGRYLYFDRNGYVVASSDEAALGRLSDDRIREAAIGFHREDGHVVAVARVPSAGWTLAFDQTIDEFQGDITGPLRRAIVLGMLGVAIAGGVAIVALLRRLRAAREEERRLREIADAREEFTSIVSHELRTPVAGLLGFLETAIDHWDVMTDADRKVAVQRSFANARTLRSLTADVLDSTAIDAHALALHPERIDLRDVVRDAIDLTSGLDDERSMTLDAPALPVMVNGDPSRLGQVVSNLIDNAMRNSPSGSPIELVMESIGTLARVTVLDHGSGIAPEDRSRVFEKFVRGAGVTARGSGLGLFIARNLVEAHGGSIDVVPSRTPGAAIAFSVPLAGDENRPA